MNSALLKGGWWTQAPGAEEMRRRGSTGPQTITVIVTAAAAAAAIIAIYGHLWVWKRCTGLQVQGSAGHVRPICRKNLSEVQ